MTCNGHMPAPTPFKHQEMNTDHPIPANCPVCLHADCKIASECLFQQAFRQQGQTGKYLRLVNPSLCSRDEGCTFYAGSKPMRYARGFRHMQEHMLPRQYNKFMTTLILHFGRNQYFKRRRGDILLTPQDQEAVRIVLERVGADSTMDFDSYEEDFQWSL